MLRYTRYTVYFLGILLLGLVSLTYTLFGGGANYPDLSTDPLIPNTAMEAAVVSEQPIGNVAVSAEGRLFYTIHPESSPTGPKLYEWKEGKAVAYPDEAVQTKLFETPLGLVVDTLNRLWVIDPANHGIGKPALTAFDLQTNTVVHRYEFHADIAPLGSFLQDLQISSDGRWIYIADVGFWAKRPGIVIYDVEKRTAQRRLNRHESVYPQNWLIRNQIKDISYLGGLLEMKTGVDGLALSLDDKWLYYGAMNHQTLYRVPTQVLQDAQKTDAAIKDAIEAMGTKPLNDGFSIDENNTVYITDVEHQAVMTMATDGSLSTLVKDERIRWADSLSFGPDGWLYVADSAIPHLALQSKEHHASNAPYYIWRFKPGAKGRAGQ